MNTAIDIEKLKFPIGEFAMPAELSAELLAQWIADIEAFPERIKQATAGISNEQLEWRYRPAGWTIRQVVHHCADSHMNALIRFKLALTEDAPRITAYQEARWAELPDVPGTDIRHSLELLSGLHTRWSVLLKSLGSEELQREYVHPEYGRRFRLDEAVGTYAWHSNHHLGHVHQALNYAGSFN